MWNRHRWHRLIHTPVRRRGDHHPKITEQVKCPICPKTDLVMTNGQVAAAVTLVKALGGGWEHSDLQTRNSHHMETKTQTTYAKAKNKTTR